MGMNNTNSSAQYPTWKSMADAWPTTCTAEQVSSDPIQWQAEATIQYYDTLATGTGFGATLGEARSEAKAAAVRAM